MASRRPPRRSLRTRRRAIGACDGGASCPPVPALYTVIRTDPVGRPRSANHWFSTRKAASLWVDRQTQPDTWYVVPFLAP